MKHCRFCDKNGLFILPLRYAAVTGHEAKKALPQLPPQLGSGVSDLLLAQAAYAPRLLRQGYLYMLVDRAGILYWDAYFVTEDAFLYKFEPDYPPVAPVEFSCDRSVCGIDASMIAIENVNTVNRIYLLFTPTPMTQGKRDEYKANAAAMVAQGRMQEFDPKGWAAGATDQPHGMQPEQLNAHVPEFMLYRQCARAGESALGQSLRAQLYPAIDAAYAGVPSPSSDSPPPGRLGRIEFKMRSQKAAAFALFDPIGMTQELNDYRNAAIDPLRPWLQKWDPKVRASNERKVHVLGCLDDVRDAFMKGLVSDRKATIDAHRDWSDTAMRRQLDRARLLRLQGRIAEAETMEQDVERARRVREGNYRRALEEAQQQAPRAWQKYAKRLPGLEPFRQELHRVNARYEQVLESRVADHLLWLRSSQLLAGLHAYDRNYPVSGQAFQEQVGMALFGMNYSDEAMQVVIDWMEQQSIADDNLLLRAYCLNQESTMRALEQSMAQARRTAQQKAAEAERWAESLDLVQQQMKGAAVAFATTNTALAQLPEQHAFRGQFIGMGAVIYTAMGQALFRRLAAWRLKGLDALYIGLFSAGLGRLNTHVRLSGLTHAGKSLKAQNRLPGQAERRVREALEAQVVQGPGGDLYKMRLAAVLALIEGVGLMVRVEQNGDRKDWGTRQWLEIAAGGITIAAAGFEMLALSAEYVQKHYASVTMTSRGAGIALGGIKLFAGGLAGFAGAVGAVYDFVDAEKARGRRRHALMGAFYLRALSQGAVAILGGFIAYAYCGPLFEFLARKIPNQFAARALQGMARGAYWLTRPAAGALVVRVVILVRVAACLTWVSVGITVLMFVLADDALEGWCDKSSFRNNPTLKERVFDSQENELEALYVAFDEVR